MGSYHRQVGFFEDTIKELNDAGVRYVVVGGLAVVLHGHIRSTVDLDLVVDLTPAEATKAMEALTSLGFVPSAPVDAFDFANPEKRRRWIEEKGMLVFHMRDPRDDFRRVDLFVEEPVDFGLLSSRAQIIRLNDTPVTVASIPDLIWMKRKAGRPIDLTDIEVLEVILEERSTDD